MWEIFEHGLMPFTELSNQKVVEEVRKGLRLPRPEKCPEQVFETM